MNIFLGNLGIEEIEKRVGIKFPQELIDFMVPRKQNVTSNIKTGQWHCFDIPFNLVCGDRQMAEEIYKYLSPMTKEFKEPLQISLSAVSM